MRPNRIGRPPRFRAVTRRRVAHRRPRLLRVGATAKSLERSPRRQCGTYDQSNPHREDPRQGGTAATTNRHPRPRLRRHHRAVRAQAARHCRPNRDDRDTHDG